MEVLQKNVASLLWVINRAPSTFAATDFDDIFINYLPKFGMIISINLNNIWYQLTITSSNTIQIVNSNFTVNKIAKNNWNVQGSPSKSYQMGKLYFKWTQIAL